MDDFTHLHVHSELSVLDGYSKITDIVKISKELGQNAIAVTDHGTLSGNLHFYKAGKEYQQKVIYGVEAYLTEDIDEKTRDTGTYHAVLLAQNLDGLRNLYRLSEIGWGRGFYSKPRIDLKTLAEYSDDLICTTACMGGQAASHIRNGQINEAVSVLRDYRSVFGDRFYIELQPGNNSDLNDWLYTLSDDLDIKSLVTADAHYDRAENKVVQELLLLSQQLSSMKQSDKEYAELEADKVSNETNLIAKLNKLWPNRRLRYDELELYLLSRQQIQDRMDAQGFDGTYLCDTTLEIADRIEPIELKRPGNYLPKLAPRLDSYDYLHTLVFDQLEERGLYATKYIERANEELALIRSKGFTDYFLVVYDLICAARSRDIYVGPGRGSAAGCLVAYCLGIVAIDPVEADLLFFRFLDPERNDFPDIDMDFEHTRRDEMKQYLRDRWTHTANIATYGVYKCKSLIKALCRILTGNEKEANEITKFLGDDLESYLESDNEKVKAFDKKYPEIRTYASKLSGHTTNTGCHAAGVVIANQPLTNLVPIESRTDPEDPQKKRRVMVCAYDKNDTEEMNLIKFDMLGLDCLTIIHDTIRMVKDRHGVDIDWEHLGTDDPEVLADLAKGNTTGVFQMESGVYRQLLRDLKVDSFKDLVASNALVRPGAFSLTKEYVKGKLSGELKYPHPSVEPFLKDTYGQYIYQEQVMQMAVTLGGFTWAEANVLRKLIGKKKDVSEFRPWMEKWIVGASRFISAKEADKIWLDWEKASLYMFNKSHAWAYSYLGYVTAWLKLNYPLEYMYGLLKNETKDTNRMTYLLEAKRLGIEILPPDVNRSQKDMSIEGDALRFGLADIKEVGYAAADEILKKRPFIDWDDFNDRITVSKCNSKVVAALIAVDAFRSIKGAIYNDNAIENYQKYLSFPIELESIIELGVEPTNLEDYDNNEFQIVCAVTKNIKRTGTYMRMELEDSTGNQTFFGSMQNDLGNNELVMAVVGQRSMLGYARIDGLKHRLQDNNLTEFEKFIFTDRLFEPYSLLRKFGIDSLDDEKSLVVPMQIREVRTKAKAMMGFIYVCDAYHDIRQLTIFPTTWPSIKPLLTEWRPVCMKLSLLRDGKGYTVYKEGIADADMVLESKQKKINGE